MTDLVEFIEARLTEDELWAKAASAGRRPGDDTVAGGVHWVWGLGGNWDHYQPDPLEEYLGENADLGAPSLVTVEEWPLSYGGALPHRVVSSDDEVRTTDAAHIARHDPARVLREVEAKRRIIAHHNVPAAVFPDEPFFRQGDRRCVGCGATYDEEPMVEDINDCPVLRAFASVWSDHPAYRPEWAPGSVVPES